jgi:hypothetical protein
MNADLTCKKTQRRQEIRDRGYNGIDFIEVLCPDQTKLCVHLFSHGLEKIEKANICIEGGTRIQDIQVIDVAIKRSEDPELEDCLRIALDKPGDFSVYMLKLVEAENGKPTDRVLFGFDPCYAKAEFSFKVCCDGDLDCKIPRVCPPQKWDEPEIDYLTKDYKSFRSLILDRLSLVMPDWNERHIPDLGIAIAEILAYTADYLSYYQDAVATEAYIGTARERISVRRHALLVDYSLNEGCNSRTFVCLNTSSDTVLDPDEIFFITSCSELNAASGTVLSSDDLTKIPDADYEVFEPLVETTGPIRIYQAHNDISFYTWGGMECCLPKGSVSATLKDSWVDQDPPVQPDQKSEKTIPVVSATKSEDAVKVQIVSEKRRALDNLTAGNLLIFEEITGPGTGDPSDADPRHRQVVRLTGIERDVDPLYNQPVLNIEWAAEDALTFSLCISTTLPSPDCSLIENVSVAHGNVLLVDHGRKVTGENLGSVGTESYNGKCNCQSITDVTYLPEKFSPVLERKPVIFRQSLNPDIPASSMLDQDPHLAMPRVILTGLSVISGKPEKLQWIPRQNLLDSRENDRHFVVENNNEGCACLRFGNGEQGMMPDAGTLFTAEYRISNSSSGNIGAEALKYLVLRTTRMSGITILPRNPMPAIGGTSREHLDNARQSAPHSYRNTLERAIIASDYAEIAERNRKIQNASAALIWNGSWYEAQVAIDPLGTEELIDPLKDEIDSNLYKVRRIGHDVAVVPAEYVPLDLSLTICVEPEFLQAHVESALLDRFSNRLLPDGTSGFFHPDNLTFGTGISVSSIIAAAQETAGVRFVTVSLKRLYSSTGNAISDGILKFGHTQIAQLDNNPRFPEHGILTLKMEGGR